MISQTVRPTLRARRPGAAERVVVVVMITVFAISLPNEWFIIRSQAEATGGIFVQLAFLSFLSVALLGINGNWLIFKEALFREPLLPSLLGLALLSTIWSETPANTFTTSIVLWITLIVAIYLMMRFPLPDLLYLVGLGLVLAMLVNYVMIFAFPSSGVQNSGGIENAWSGAFRSRNTLGRLAVVSATTFGFNVRIRKSILVWPALTALAIIQVVGTGSATSLGTLFAIATISVTFLGFRGRKHLYGATAVALTTVFGVVTAAAAVNLSGVTALVGRDATFTGRLPLWINSFEHGIRHRPLLGYGWNGFWTGGGADFDVLIRSNFDAPHSHNAFVDTWLQAGVLASILLVAIYVRGLFWATRNVRRDTSVLGLVPAAMISLSLLFSFSETGFVGRSANFILLIVGLIIAAENKGVQRPFLPEGSTDDGTNERVAIGVG